jgi:hypothetical protein
LAVPGHRGRPRPRGRRAPHLSGTAFPIPEGHAAYAHLLTPVPVEHRPPVEPPDDWQTIAHFGVRLKLPPTFVPSSTNKTRENGHTVVYVDPATKTGILINKPTDGRRDLRQSYDRLEIDYNFPSDVRPWATIYDYWLTIGTASHDQFSWTLSPQHVRELDWTLRLRKQRLAVEFMLTKSNAESLHVLGENEYTRWIVQRQPEIVSPSCLAQVFSKSDHRTYTLNWIDRDIDRATENILRLCNSVRFE